MRNLLLTLGVTLWIAGCTNSGNMENEKNLQSNITSETQNIVIENLKLKVGDATIDRMEQGVKHAASLWSPKDGNEDEFVAYCNENFIIGDDERKTVFNKISRNIEIIYGYYHRMNLDLNKPLDEAMGELHKIDGEFGGYNASAHFMEDMYSNKLAFYIALNFPYYDLDEKNKFAEFWSREDWAYARLGDLFTSRIPPEIIQNYSKVSTQSGMYISDYNIYAGKLLDESGNYLFPEDMVLLSHWNIRDEIKSNYGNNENGLVKQGILYEVMKRIIDQSIPQDAINKGTVDWNPVTNKIYDDKKEIAFESEPDTRYSWLLENFKANRLMDEYTPLNSAIKRAFEGNMEISQVQVEKIFTEFLSSDEVKQVAGIIETRLGRKLKPWDIWYDGFKSRSGMDGANLDKITTEKYPNPKAFEADMPKILEHLGFTPAKSKYLADKIVVDAARGSGHAAGAQMKGDVAHLRTRIPTGGMNYKGYNIAIHEFGHNVEQTLSLYDVDQYMLNGVPNTAFTEALAFIFQKRDLNMLGIDTKNPDRDAIETLDLFWSGYEIMGVSILDQRVWKWMYEHPETNASELKSAVITIAKEVWNEFYAPIFGSSDEPILAIYSHMISYPLYLSNYAIGNLIEFQVEQHLKTSDFAKEVERIYTLGRLTPNEWMKQAVHAEISAEPLILETRLALEYLNKK